MSYYWEDDDHIDEDKESLKIFKTKNIIYDGSDVVCQQVESIKVENELEDEGFVEPLHLITVNQFENLHSITIPINSFQILSNLSNGIFQFPIKSLKNFKITSINSRDSPIELKFIFNLI
ncbi:hypothetical protein ACTFIT_009508 [Dictyostelium discoideum]